MVTLATGEESRSSEGSREIATAKHDEPTNSMKRDSVQQRSENLNAKPLNPKFLS